MKLRNKGISAPLSLRQEQRKVNLALEEIFHPRDKLGSVVNVADI